MSDFNMDEWKARFTYNQTSETWLYGNRQTGMGIYEEKVMGDKRYFANMIIDGDLTVGFGPFETLDIAKEEMIKHYWKAQENI